MEIISKEHNRFEFINTIKSIEDPYFIICLDIINFKKINETYGFRVGDLILKELIIHIDSINLEGIDIKSYIYEKDTIFAIVRNANIDNITEIIKKISFNKYSSIEFKFRTCYVKVKNLKDATSFIENVSKIIRKNKYIINNNKEIKIDVSRDVEIYKEIKEELLTNQETFFSLVYQPKVDIKTSKIDSCEILSRWNHPKLGAVSPYEFIPIIKDLNKEYEFDLYIFEKACRSLKDIKDIKKFSVNISTNTMKVPNVAEKLNYITRKYNIDNENITIEILEDNSMDDCKLMNINVDKLYNLGFSISIDDFGTGYSSYYRLSTLNFSEVKIPREFLLLENNNDKNKDVLDGIISLCKKLKCTIISEGVENINDYNLMKNLGVDYIQGYYYSKPLSKDNFIEFIVDYNRRLEEDGKADISGFIR